MPGGIAHIRLENGCDFISAGPGSKPANHFRIRCYRLPGFLAKEFFGFGGILFRRLGVLVIGGGPECGEGTAAGNVSKSG